MSIRPAVAFLLASLLSLPSSAKDATVGQVSIALTAPPGQCELDPKQAGDARMLQTVQEAIGSNTLLAMSADCQQLADWRIGKRGLLEDFAQYQTLTAAMDGPPESAPH